MSPAEVNIQTLVDAANFEGCADHLLVVAWDLLDPKSRLALVTHPTAVAALKAVGEELVGDDEQYKPYLDAQAIDTLDRLMRAARAYYDRPFTFGLAERTAANLVLRTELTAAIRAASAWANQGRITEPCRKALIAVLTDVEDQLRRGR